MTVDPDSISADAGAYALLIRLGAPWSPGIRTLPARILAPGPYIYCGSAYGPGGLRARVARHLRAGKRTHWHVDRLTSAGRIEDVAVRVGGRECDLVAAFMACGAEVPLTGFGSSDCRRCASHLLAAPAGFDGAALKAAVTLGRRAAAPL
jgi:Uri superfamily endonuclease